MKQFRPYHFPPLHQFTTALPPGASSPGNGAGSAEEWQAALADAGEIDIQLFAEATAE